MVQLRSLIAQFNQTPALPPFPGDTMLTLKNIFISLFSILFALLSINAGINPAMAQEAAAPLPTVILVGDVDNTIPADTYVAAWSLTEPSIFCPISVPLSEGGKNFTPVKGMNISLTRTAEQLNWVVGTYRLDEDNYTLLTGEDWTSCMSFSFMEDGTGDNQLYQPADYLPATAPEEVTLPKISTIGILPPVIKTDGSPSEVINRSHYRVMWWSGDEGKICPEVPDAAELKGVAMFELSLITGDAEADTQSVTVNQGQHTIGTYVLNADGTLHLQQNSCLQTYVTADRTLYRPVITELPTAVVVTEKTPLIRKPDWRHFMAGLTPQTWAINPTQGGGTALLDLVPAMDLTFGVRLGWSGEQGKGGLLIDPLRAYLGGGFYSVSSAGSDGSSYPLWRASLGQDIGGYAFLGKGWQLHAAGGYQIGRSPIVTDCDIDEGNLTVSCYPNGQHQFEAAVASPFLAPALSLGVTQYNLVDGFAVQAEVLGLWEFHALSPNELGRMRVWDTDGVEHALSPVFYGRYSHLVIMPTVTVLWQ